LFKKFLEWFVPKVTGRRRKLYDIRSGLFHGSMPPILFDTDIHFGIGPQEELQWQHARHALGEALMAVHNWLREPTALVPAP
jgi:hypothetical protein